MSHSQSPRRWPRNAVAWLIGAAFLLTTSIAAAQDEDAPPKAKPAANRAAAPMRMSLKEMLDAGGTIGYVIIGLSVGMVALLVEHLITLRRGVLIPAGLPEQVHQMVGQGQFRQAEQLALAHPSFLGRLLSVALAETSLGYGAMQKAMEDAAAEQAARMNRKIEWFSVIGTLAPMLGLLGTVWGMILAFMEFEQKANPQVSELAPGIYKALVTTLQGLIVAIPSLAAFAYTRNRIDELVAETSLMAEHVFSDFRRAQAMQRRASRRKKQKGTATKRPAPPIGGVPAPPERERPR